MLCELINWVASSFNSSTIISRQVLMVFLIDMDNALSLHPKLYCSWDEFTLILFGEFAMDSYPEMFLIDIYIPI